MTEKKTFAGVRDHTEDAPHARGRWPDVLMHRWPTALGIALEGEHYRLDRPLSLPQSLSRPHPPIMIAGEGERKTLRLVTRYADACSLRPSPEIPRKPAVLRRHWSARAR
jgi:alkanesulfonate monooxygenase SsuD/methylene tetrahydromethanopterin reductase-like flavin-dependent oxidoreductase (luciferase family)